MKNSKDRDVRESSLGCLLTLLMIPAFVGWASVIVPLFWAWFLAPVTGVASPSWATCAGLVLFARYATANGSNKGNATDLEEDVARFIANAVYPAIVLGIGYLIHLAQ